MKETLILKIDPEKPDPVKIEIAAKIIRNGGLVAFPTETVYGLGADALNADAVLALFEAKKRPLDNPPIVHIANSKDIQPLVQEIPEKAKLLTEKFWPGPLTLLFKHSQIVPSVTTAGLDTVALRMPKHKIALAIIRASCRPIAAPSANLAGKPSPTNAHHVWEDLNGRIDAIIDGGSTSVGVESTVVDLTVNPPILLRPGGTTFEDLKRIIGDLKLHEFVKTEKELPLEKIRSPGMKHRHYAPKAQVILIEGSMQTVICKIQELTKIYDEKGMKVGILGTDETRSSYKTDVVKSLGSRFNLPAIAQNLFGSLREIDAQGVDIILAEGLPSEGMGLAVMNRLRKASGYNIIKAE